MAFDLGGDSDWSVQNYIGPCTALQARPLILGLLRYSDTAKVTDLYTKLGDSCFYGPNIVWSRSTVLVRLLLSGQQQMPDGEKVALQATAVIPGGEDQMRRWK